ncbi:MAG: isopenicillin N synthase-like dioxygenase [Ascidiaceihabitans sp.]|jgi:isopenicillin N synthase-like dioxygenase
MGVVEFLTAGQVNATPHRVVVGNAESISEPLFFRPAHDTNVAPTESGEVALAGDHLCRRFKVTYLNLKNG